MSSYRCELCGCNSSQNGDERQWLIVSDKMRLCPLHRLVHADDAETLAFLDPPVRPRPARPALRLVASNHLPEVAHASSLH